MPLSLIGVFCFAVFSWTFIEKPTLKLKRLFLPEKRR